MKGYETTLDSEQLKKVQEAIIKSCERSSAFKERFLKAGFSYYNLYDGKNYSLVDLTEPENEKIKNLLMNLISHRNLVRSNIEKNIFVKQGEENLSFRDLTECVDLDHIYVDGKTGDIVNEDGIVLVTKKGRLSDDLDYYLPIKYIPCDRTVKGYDVTRCLAYDLSILGPFITAEISTSTRGEVSLLLIDSLLSNIDIEEFVPNLIRPEYRWSKASSTAKFRALFSQILIKKNVISDDKDILKGNVGLVHIYMNGDDMVWDMLVGDDDSEKYSKVVTPEDHGIYSASETLLNIFRRWNKPIKEVYIIVNGHNKERPINGKCIVRKCENDEYVMTIY